MIPLVSRDYFTKHHYATALSMVMPCVFFELKTEVYITDMDLMFQNVKAFQYMKKINKVP
jgi:hypothetical protein